MATRFQFTRVALGSAVFGIVIGLSTSWTSAQESKVKSPEFKNGMELKVRKAGEDKFTDKTQKYGVETFLDPNSNKNVYISEVGAITVVNPGVTDAKGKQPDWLHAMELRVRKAGEADFNKDTKKYGIEVFKDDNTGNLIYVCETGSVAVVPVGQELAKGKDPVWKHAMELKVRKAGEADFKPETQKFGIEVFRDENNGNLIYITQTGSIAVVAGATTKEGKVQAPEWTHALELKVRKAGETDFNDKTKKIGLEIYKDTNVDKLVYITEVGSISVPGNLTVTDPKPKTPEWKHGLELRARKAGEAEFSPTTKRYGLEIYTDLNTGGLVYISEVGTIASLK
jgi:hypothetical protein